MPLDYTRELDASVLIRDTRPMGAKIKSTLTNPTVALGVAGFSTAVAWSASSATELFSLTAIAIAALHFHWRRAINSLPMRVPKSSGLMDGNERDLKTNEIKKAEGIIYLGQDVESGDQIWISDDMARTHMAFLGTTGSGKTEMLISLASNALVHGSGLIYADGKADSSLYGKLYSMARLFGREQDVRVVNFQTGAKDIFGPQEVKMSNTMNPFAQGSSGMLSQLSVSMFSSGKGDMWEGRAIAFVESLMKPLVYLRDNYGLLLDVKVIRDFFELPMIEELTWEYEQKYPGVDQTLDGLKAYLGNLTNYSRAKHKQQHENAIEQHSYITMQLVRAFGSLSDTYGYIMRTPLAEIDFLDVFLNRRILIVLLPALEKSPAELTNLGRIIVAAVKSTMAVGLGSQIEGLWSQIIDSKPTTSPSPFICVLDEYGYYAVEGFAVVPAQARSLGFSAVFAGQDLPAFQKASEKEADSTLANTNLKLCGKMTCAKTYDYFSKIAGAGYYTRTSGYVGQMNDFLGSRAYRDGDNASIEKMERVTLDTLAKQPSGKWHLFFGGKIVRMNGFFADFSSRSGRNVKMLRVNHFLKIRRPDRAKCIGYVQANEHAEAILASEEGIRGSVEAFPSRDVALLADALTLAETSRFSGESKVMQMIGALAMMQASDGVSEAAYADVLDEYAEDSTGNDHRTFDVMGDASTGGAVDFLSGMRQLEPQAAQRKPMLLEQGWNVDRGHLEEGQADLDPPEFADLAMAESAEADPSARSRAAEFRDFDADWYGDDADLDRVNGLFGGTDRGVEVSRFDTGELNQFNPQFDSSQTGGELSRVNTAAGVYAVQKRFANTSSEASMVADSVTQQMSQATVVYDGYVPIAAASAEAVVSLAERISLAFAELDEEVHRGAIQ